MIASRSLRAPRARALAVALEQDRETAPLDLERDAVLVQDARVREAEDQERLELGQAARVLAETVDESPGEAAGRALVDVPLGALHLVAEVDVRVAVSPAGQLLDGQLEELLVVANGLGHVRPSPGRRAGTRRGVPQHRLREESARS
jgi:hypothetical protein